MNLKEALLKEHSKAQKNIIVEMIGDNKALFFELWTIIKTGEAPLPQRAVWVFDSCVAQHPALFDYILDDAIAFLPGNHHNAIHRNITKALSRTEIPERHQGVLYSLCIDWLLSPTIAVAIKAPCMTIAYNIAKPIPELQEELALVIKDQMEFNSAGFTSRGRKILKKMSLLSITNAAGTK